MTRAQELMTLIEAYNPISAGDIRHGTGWARSTIWFALAQLQRFGVVRRVNVGGSNRPHYKPC